MVEGTRDRVEKGSRGRIEKDPGIGLRMIQEKG